MSKGGDVNEPATTVDAAGHFGAVHPRLHIELGGTRLRGEGAVQLVHPLREVLCVEGSSHGGEVSAYELPHRLVAARPEKVHAPLDRVRECRGTGCARAHLGVDGASAALQFFNLCTPSTTPT
jgi:hypothetical protein